MRVASPGLSFPAPSAQGTFRKTGSCGHCQGNRTFPARHSRHTMTSNAMTDTSSLPQNHKKHPGATITLVLQPSGRTSIIPRPKTVHQLLDRLGYLEETALVIRNGRLLTPDLAILPDETITVRSIISHG